MAALTEIGGAWLIWQRVREQCGHGSSAESFPWAVRIRGHAIGSAVCLIGVTVIMYAPRT
nr:hypothetical protein [Alloactinosynnema sp. L-07]